jgi:hypothetical protein
MAILINGDRNYRLIEARVIRPALAGRIPLRQGVDATASARAAALLDPTAKRWRAASQSSKATTACALPPSDFRAAERFAACDGLQPIKQVTNPRPLHPTGRAVTPPRHSRQTKHATGT